MGRTTEEYLRQKVAEQPCVSLTRDAGREIRWLSDIEAEVIARVYAHTGSLRKTAHKLWISVPTVRKWLRR